MSTVSARSRLLVESLLQEARAGQHAPEVRTVDLAAIVTTLVSVSPRGRGHRIAVGPLPTVVSNPELLSIVMRNLLLNAVKHSSVRASEINVTADRQPEGGGSP